MPSMNSSPDIHREKRHSQFSKGEIPKLQNEKGEKKEKKVPKYKVKRSLTLERYYLSSGK